MESVLCHAACSVWRVPQVGRNGQPPSPLIHRVGTVDFGRRGGGPARPSNLSLYNTRLVIRISRDALALGLPANTSGRSVEPGWNDPRRDCYPPARFPTSAWIDYILSFQYLLSTYFHERVRRHCRWSQIRYLKLYGSCLSKQEGGHSEGPGAPQNKVPGRRVTSRASRPADLVTSKCLALQCDGTCQHSALSPRDGHDSGLDQEGEKHTRKDQVQHWAVSENTLRISDPAS